jgi:ribosomal protein S1
LRKISKKIVAKRLLKGQVKKDSSLKLKDLPYQEPKSMEDLLTKVGLPLSPRRGQEVSGVVVSASPTEVLVDIGGKSEGVIRGRELDFAKELGLKFEVGDTVIVRVAIAEDEAGSTLLSVRSVGTTKRWQSLEEKKEKQEEIEVKGLEVQRSGLLVEYGGIRGFIPATLLDPQFLGKAQDLVGKTIRAQVIEVDQAQNRVILSQKPLIPSEELVKRLSKFKIGESYPAIVSSVLPFGVLVDLAGVPGLIHLSEISWEKVTDPAFYFKVGDKIEVLVLGYEEGQGRLNLSTKQLGEDPWAKVSQKYNLEEEVKGKVVRVADFGVFVQLEKGVEGLLHISKIPPGVELKLGSPVDCLIESLEPEKRRISLSLVLREKPVGYR